MLDDGEVFDSTLLKETVTNYVATGKNNVLIDLVQLDYIYSDSMNVIMFLNKSIQETGGNFGLLQVRPEVIQILQKAGVANTLRIFNSEEEAQSFSMSLMQGQQQGFAQQGSQSQSEFDQLRSEIGSVFGGAEQPSQDFGNQGYAQQAQPRQPASHPMQQPQNPYARPGFPTQQPQFQGRQYTPPPPPPLTPTRPIVPPPVQAGGMSGTQKPPVRPPFSTDQTRAGSQQQEYATETQRFQQIPQVPVQPKKAEPPIPASFNDELEEITSKAGRPRAEMPSARLDGIDIDDDFLGDDMPKKKSPVGIIVAFVLLLALAGAGYYVMTSGILDGVLKPQPTVQKPETKPAVTPAPVTPPPVVATEPPPPTTLEPVKPEPAATEPVKKAPVKKAPVKKAPVAPKKVVRKSVAPRAKKVSTNRIQISSSPVGALISVNGEMIGKTPYTWDKPVFGPISIELSKAGYKSTSKDIEFTGGVIKESFTLERDLPPPPPKPEPVAIPAPEPKRPEPVATPTPSPTPAPEPKPSKPVVSTPVVSTAGGDASIYFASLPPIAEVYLNGKLVGRTNVAELKLPSGTHVLRFVKGAKEVTQEITLQPGKNPSRLIRLP